MSGRSKRGRSRRVLVLSRIKRGTVVGQSREKSSISRGVVLHHIERERVELGRGWLLKVVRSEDGEEIESH